MSLSIITAVTATAGLQAWMNTNLVGSVPLSFIGAAAVVVLLGSLVWMVVSMIARAVGGMSRSARTAAIRRDDVIGPKILLGLTTGPKSKAVDEFFQSALADHMPRFNFGSPFKVIKLPSRLEALDRDNGKMPVDVRALAERTLYKSDASMLLWSVFDRKRKSFTVFMLAQDPVERTLTRFRTYDMPIRGVGSDDKWSDEQAKGFAYVVAKTLQPALGRPQDFRSERLQPIVSEMESLLMAERAVVGKTRFELEDDFAAGALHLGEETGEMVWVEKAAAQRARALDLIDVSEEPVRWATAKIDLGRSLCTLCEKRFDPVRMQEAMAHLREAVDHLKADERMKLTDTALAALGKAEQTLANRRRFSIRWTV